MLRTAIIYLLSISFLSLFAPVYTHAATETDENAQIAYIKYLEERIKTAVIEITGTDKVIVIVKADFGAANGKSGGGGSSVAVMKKEKKADQEGELLPGVPKKKQFTVDDPVVFMGETKQEAAQKDFVSLASVSVLIDKSVSEELIKDVHDVLLSIIGEGNNRVVEIKLIDFRKTPNPLSNLLNSPNFYWLVLTILMGASLTVSAYFLSNTLRKFSSGLKGNLTLTQQTASAAKPAAEKEADKKDTPAASAEAERLPLYEENTTGRFSFVKPGNLNNLSMLLDERPPEDTAIVVSFLSPELAVKLLDYFSEERRTEVMVKLSGLKEIEPDLINGIEETLREGMRRIIRGEDKVASLLGLADQGFRDKVFGVIESGDSAAMSRIKRKVKGLETIIEEMSQEDIRSVFRNLDVSVFARVIMSFPEELRNKVVDSLPEGAAVRLKQEIDLSKPLPPAKLMEEKRNLLSLIHRLSESGLTDVSHKEPV